MVFNWPGNPASYGQMQSIADNEPQRSTTYMPGALAETVSAVYATTTLTPSSGQLYLWPVHLGAGQSVGHVGYVADSTQSASLTHQWVCVTDNAYTVQAVSADGTSATLTANKFINTALAAAYTTTYSGTYFLGAMISSSGGTQPTMAAATSPRAVLVTGTNVPTPVLGGTSNGSQSTPLAVGTVCTAPTAVSAVPYMWVSA